MGSVAVACILSPTGESDCFYRSPEKAFFRILLVPNLDESSQMNARFPSAKACPTTQNCFVSLVPVRKRSRLYPVYDAIAGDPNGFNGYTGWFIDSLSKGSNMPIQALIGRAFQLRRCPWGLHACGVQVMIK